MDIKIRGLFTLLSKEIFKKVTWKLAVVSIQVNENQ